MEARGCLFWQVTEVLPFKNTSQLCSHFIRRSAAENGTQKPDGNLTRLSPPARLVEGMELQLLRAIVRPEGWNSALTVLG